jgi:hypothetical protein
MLKNWGAHWKEHKILYQELVSVRFLRIPLNHNFFYRFYDKSRFQFVFFFVLRKSLLINQNSSVFDKLFFVSKRVVSAIDLWCSRSRSRSYVGFVQKRMRTSASPRYLFGKSQFSVAALLQENLIVVRQKEHSSVC